MLIGYSVFSARGDAYAAIRRSTDRGRTGTWEAPILLSPRLGPAEGDPVLSNRARLWRVAFTRCNNFQCSSQSVVYRQSGNGLVWSSPQQVTGSAFPDAKAVGVDRVGIPAHSFVVFETLRGATDLYFRRTT